MNIITTGLPTINIPPATTEDRIAASVAKPNAFSKPAALKGTKTQGERSTRFRPLIVKSKGQRRVIKKRDPRHVKFY
jgi:hypothetical protein